MVDPLLSLTQEGAMTYLEFGLARPWPKVTTKSGKIRLVRYCYANAAAKDNLPCVLQHGFKIWAEPIGHPASPANGHCLGLKEIDDRNSEKEQRKNLLCYLDDYKSKNEPGT
jgi:hypothetical protein